MESYYDVLGVKDYAQTDEVRKAYFAKLLTLHPDKSHCDENTEILTKLKQCYDALRNPVSKAQYDQSLKGNVNADQEGGIDSRIHPEYSVCRSFSVQENELDMVCDQCGNETTVNIEPDKEGDEKNVVVECEWCSKKYLITLGKKSV